MKKTRHFLIKEILMKLNYDYLKNAYFGGGTYVSFLCDEYRLSNDIDFICYNMPAFRKIRSLSRANPNAFFDNNITIQRVKNNERYAIRYKISYKNLNFKFEILASDKQQYAPCMYLFDTVPALSLEDLLGEKLIANYIRGLDSYYLFRDLLDIGALFYFYGSLRKKKYIEKLSHDYQVDLMDGLNKSIELFIEKKDKIDLSSLEVDSLAVPLRGLAIFYKENRLPLPWYKSYFGSNFTP